MVQEFRFRSSNKKDDVQGWLYAPQSAAAGVVQMVHGFHEHSYMDMITRLMDAGFVVCVGDHVRQGKSAHVNDEWGDSGFHSLMEDEHKLTEIAREHYPQLPWFLFGHSMGSFIARDYIANYGKEIRGVALCGTYGQFPDIAETIEKLKQRVAEGRGEESDPELVGQLLGWMLEKYPDGMDLTKLQPHQNPYAQLDHTHDLYEIWSKPTTNRALLDFYQMAEKISGPEWAKKVPRELPVYNVGQVKDPMDKYNSDVYQVSNWLMETGHQVRTHLYPGYQSPVDNFVSVRDDVEEGVVTFLQELI